MVKRNVASGGVTMWHSYVSDTRQLFLILCSSHGGMGGGATEAVKKKVGQPLGCLPGNP